MNPDLIANLNWLLLSYYLTAKIIRAHQQHSHPAPDPIDNITDYLANQETLTELGHLFAHERLGQAILHELVYLIIGIASLVVLINDAFLTGWHWLSQIGVTWALLSLILIRFGYHAEDRIILQEFQAKHYH